MMKDSDDRHSTSWSNSQQHALVMKIDTRKSSSLSTHKQKRKSSTSMLIRFRRAAKIVVLLLRGFRQTKIYFNDEEAELKIQQSLRAILLHDDDDDNSDARSSVPRKCMIGHRLHLCLTTLPQHRNDAIIRQILWFLKAMKAFQNLFPVEMEKEVAKYVEYARYDEGRLIANQGRRPEFLYFIISGRVKLVRQFRLMDGVVNKFMGFIAKGKSTNPDELNEQCIREDSLVAAGSQVEMLLLNREVFSYLQHTTNGPPLDFIRSLRFFHRFPVESFLANPDAIDYRYYGEGKIVVEDSNRTPWLYIIKTGFVRVVRRQMVRYCRTFKDSYRSTEEKEADTSRRRTNKKVMVKFNVEEILLPKVHEVRSLNDFCCPVKKQHLNTSESIENDHRKRHKTKPSSRRLSRQFDTIAEEDSSCSENCSTDISPIGRETNERDVRLLPVLREEKQRMAFLQLDILTAGDIFGLDHLHPTVASEPKGVSLVSGGAELIQIRKRFYMNCFGSDGLHATDSVCKEYISEKMAEEDLLKQESWRRYKASVYQRATAGCGSSSSSASLTTSTNNTSRNFHR